MNFLSEAPATSVGNSSVANWDPVLISLVRRAMPNMMAYDVCGVQPMTGPTGLIFAMKARYGTGETGSTEALFAEANTTYSGDSSGTHAGDTSGLLGLDPGAHYEDPNQLQEQDQASLKYHLHHRWLQRQDC